MQHRSYIPQKERYARSKLAKLLHDQPFVKGVLVTSQRTCGKQQCKCTRGERHLSSYLSIRHEGKRKMICVPKQWENRIRISVKTYKNVMELMNTV